MLPYGRHSISDEDIRAVSEVLRGDWLTTGPVVERFERAVCELTGAKHGVAVSSGTAALHVAYEALGIGPGDEVVVPALTFVATANAALYCGATPVFADVLSGTLLVDPASVESRLSAKTKAIVAVDYAGQPCDYARLRELAARRRVALVADACHSLGGSTGGAKVGSLADATILSFHPVKHITTGEGGMVLTDDDGVAARARSLRNHGVSTDALQRMRLGTWAYDMAELGHNYRLSDFACALGASQLRRLPAWVERRRELAAIYDTAFAGSGYVAALERDANAGHAFHLYVVRLASAKLRAGAFADLRDAGIGANVHYRPVYQHSYYRRRFGDRRGLCPHAERAYDVILSLPLFPAMQDEDAHLVADRLKNFIQTSLDHPEGVPSSPPEASVA
jgi:UDP-4-amino-4,6-dideoxy-N-acetyl-beta-L-altrosamine transaminase